jgi:hypothetical protein
MRSCSYKATTTPCRHLNTQQQQQQQQPPPPQLMSPSMPPLLSG